MSSDNDIVKIQEDNTRLKTTLEETRAVLDSLLNAISVRNAVPVSGEATLPIVLDNTTATIGDSLAGLLDAENIGVLSSVIPDGKFSLSRSLRFFMQLDEVVGREEFLSRVHPDDREKVASAFDAALDPEGDGMSCAVFRTGFEGNQERTLSCRLTAAERKGRKKKPVLALTGIFRETERKAEPVPPAYTEDEIEKMRDDCLKAQETANRHALEIESSFAAVVEGLILYDAHGKILRMNDAAHKILLRGKPDADTPFGKRLSDLVIRKTDGSVLDPGESPAHRALRGETVRNYILELHHKNHGSLTWVSVNSAPVYRGSGELAGAVTTFVDITELKQAEAAIRAAKEDADKANSAKSEFLAHMSHELRTPIGGILGLADVLKARLRNEEDLSFLKMIGESAKLLLGIIGDILDLSRIESGKIELSPVDFNLRDEVRTLVSTFSVSAGERGDVLSHAVSDDVPETLNGDPERLMQIFRNLLSNAVKYTENGRIGVHVQCGKTDDKRVELVCSVADTGEGIPEDKRHLLFREFVRLENVYARKKEQGAGLGLAISRRLVEMMGGTIGVESVPGKGSTFRFTVTLEKADEGRSRTRQERPPQHILSALPQLKVLLAEDNRINQLFLTAVLEQAGHEVTAVENGLAAVEAVESAAAEGVFFDVVLMDIQMPEMDGMEATRMIRTIDGEAGKTTIIALTAFAMKGDESRFFEAGMDGYVTKPVDFEKLAHEIRKTCLGK